MLATLLVSVVSVVFVCAASSWGVSRAEEEDDKLYLEHTDILYADEARFPGASVLVGSIKFRHGGMTLTCDSALYYQRRQDFEAYGNVYMWQGDTLEMWCDELYYTGNEQLAEARLDVRLRHRNTWLTTDSLDYARQESLGSFKEGGKMVDGDNTLTSEYGEYSTATHIASFYTNVRLNNPKAVMRGSQLHYNTDTKIAHVTTHTEIDHGEDHIHTRLAYYHTTPDQVILLKRSRLFNSEREMVADSIFYDNKQRIGEAWGDVVYTDMRNKNMFTCEYCHSNDSTGYSEATGRARGIDYSQRDSLFLHADTFKVYTYNIRTDSAYRVMHAYPHMRAYRVDLQAVADSMVADGRDSTLRLYKDPILWQDKQQVVGEEVIAFLNDSTLDSVLVNRQAMSIERMDSVHFNQIASNYMHIYFKEGKLRHTFVELNVKINYFPLDDDSLMIGMNYTETTEARMFFTDEQKIDHIWMPAAEGILYPLPMVPESKLYLDNFAWFDYIRPRDKDDIFEWRPKKAGTELKESVLHTPPLQTLDRFKNK